MLLADLVDRHGFHAFRVAQDLSELRPIKNPRSRQVFYFDDFLGKTTLDKVQKNEDQRIVELMEEVSSNPNWRFILTTREYILNTATMRYEAFAQPKVPIQMCIVNLGDYTRPVRAKILYNHIFFSELPREYKLALLDGRATSESLQTTAAGIHRGARWTTWGGCLTALPRTSGASRAELDAQSGGLLSTGGGSLQGAIAPAACACRRQGRLRSC